MLAPQTQTPQILVTPMTAVITQILQSTRKLMASILTQISQPTCERNSIKIIYRCSLTCLQYSLSLAVNSKSSFKPLIFRILKSPSQLPRSIDIFTVLAPFNPYKSFNRPAQSNASNVYLPLTNSNTAILHENWRSRSRSNRNEKQWPLQSVMTYSSMESTNASKIMLDRNPNAAIASELHLHRESISWLPVTSEMWLVTYYFLNIWVYPFI